VSKVWKPRYLVWLLALPFAWWVLREIPFTQIGDTFKNINPSQFVLWIAVNSLIFLFFSSRWWLILRAQGHQLPYRALVGYRLSSFAISYFTPGTQFGGEPLQVYMLKAHHYIPTANALASVSLDKLFELLANFTFLTVGVILILSDGPVGSIANTPAFLAAGGLLGLPLLYLAVLWSGRAPLTWVANKVPGRLLRSGALQKAPRVIASAEEQISALLRQRPFYIIGALLISGLIWALMLAEYWLTYALLGARLSPAQTIFLMTAARLAFLTPLPGGLGALEASQALAMGALGLSPALGISASLLIRGRDVLFGLLGFWWGAVLTRRAEPTINPTT